jgi:DNA polymerase III subunit delta'
MRLNKVVGNEKIKEELKQQLRLGEVPHAQLFLGSEGSGNLAMALAYAQTLQCESRDDFDACGVCSSCQRASRHLHPDILYSFPYHSAKSGSKSNSEEFLPAWRSFLSKNPYADLGDWLEQNDWRGKNPTIYAAEVNHILLRLQERKFEGNYKVMILWLPEYLGKEGNRMLKFIEEPERDVIVLMVGHNSGRILPTLLSRCRILPFQPLETKHIHQYLLDQFPTQNKEITTAAAFSEGNLSLAIRWMNYKNENQQILLLDFLRSALKGNNTSMFQWSEKFSKLDMEEQKQFFIFGLQFFKLMLRSKFQKENSLNFNDELNKAANYLLTNIKLSLFMELTEFFDKALYYLERNTNAKILGITAVIRAYKIFNKHRFENLSIYEGKFFKQ